MENVNKWDRVIKWSQEKQEMETEMMEGGMKVIPREIHRKAKFDPKYALLEYLLIKARYTDGEEWYKKQWVELKRGQLVTSLRDLEDDKELGQSFQQIRDGLAFWEGMLFLTLQAPHRHHSIITIWVYDKFDKLAQEEHTKEHSQPIENIESLQEEEHTKGHTKNTLTDRKP
jgi:hypothetical protein